MALFTSGGRLRFWLRLLVFYGAFGILVGAALILIVLLGGFAHITLTSGDDLARIDPWPFSLGGLAVLAPLALLTIAARRWLDKKPPLVSLGLTTRQLPAGLFGGLALGVGFMALNALALWMLKGAHFTTARIPDTGTLAGLAFFFLVFAACEELLFRGYPFRALAESARPWVAIVITSAAFGILHGFNPGAGPFALLNICLAGVILALLYFHTHNLWLAIGFHWGWNWAEGAGFGFAVSGLGPEAGFLQAIPHGPRWLSGGEFGPEASIVMTGTTVAAILTLLLVRPFRRGVAPEGSAYGPPV